MQRDEEIVEVGASLAWVTLHQGEVLGTEQHPGHMTQDVTRARDRGAVDPRAVGPSGVDLQFDQDVATVACRSDPHEGPFCALAHEGPVQRDAVGLQGAGIAHRLDQIGLALAVGTEEDRVASLELQLHLVVGAEVRDAQRGDVHYAGRRTGISRYR